MFVAVRSQSSQPPGGLFTQPANRISAHTAQPVAWIRQFEMALITSTSVFHTLVTTRILQLFGAQMLSHLILGIHQLQLNANKNRRLVRNAFQ